MIRLLILIPLLLSMQDVRLQVFPPDNPWNWDISRHPVHPNSDNFIADWSEVKIGSCMCSAQNLTVGGIRH